MTRRQIREHVMRLVFCLSCWPKEEWEEQTEQYFEEIPDEDLNNPPLFASDEERAYIKNKAFLVLENRSRIDALLDEKAKGWTTKRMGKADLAILRLAVYEMKEDEDIPTGVAINEAVELAKQYGGDESKAFVNGILASLAGKEEA